MYTSVSSQLIFFFRIYPLRGRLGVIARTSSDLFLLAYATLLVVHLAMTEVVIIILRASSIFGLTNSGSSENLRVYINELVMFF